jgi:hypothetical protein
MVISKICVVWPPNHGMKLPAVPTYRSFAADRWRGHPLPFSGRPTMTRRLASLLLILAARAAPLAAQGEPGVDDIAHAVLRADSTRDWRALLFLAHPTAIVEFKESQVRQLSLDRDEAFAAAARESRCLQQSMAKWRRLTLDSIYHVPSSAALSQLPPDTVFVLYQRWYARRPSMADMDSLMPHAERRYVGSVQANDTTAYGILLEVWKVLPMPEWPAEQAQVMTFRRFQGAWRSMLDPDFGGRPGIMATMDDGSGCE